MSNIQVFNGTLAGKEQSLTTSRIVAGVFGRQHKNVLKAVDQLECSREFTERNFQPSEYRDPSGRQLREYRMTRDGFMFLAMGFTGHEAARRKEGFIETFNDMEARLRKPAPLPMGSDRELFVSLMTNLEARVRRQEAQIVALSGQLLRAKDKELRFLRLRSNEESQRRIDRVILLEAAGAPRVKIAAETGLSFNYIRQIVFRARRDGHLLDEPAAQGKLDLHGVAA